MATPTMAEYEAAQAAYIARVVAGEVGIMGGEYESLLAMGHAAKFPNGCREPGHHCEACHARLGEPAHKVDAVRVGGRPGYRAQWRYECRQCTYRAGA